MKRMALLLLCVLLIASCFAGCGKKEEPVDLVVWTAYAEGTPSYEVAVQKIEEFEESRGVNLEVMHYGSDLATVLYTALDSGERIDVFPLGSTIQLASQFDHTMDLTSYVESSDIKDRSYPIHLELIKAESENNDEYHAIPTLSSFGAFWYNKEAFEKVGITETPVTIDEFEAVCDKLVAAGYHPIALDSAYAGSTFGIFCGRLVGEEAIADMVFNGGFSENERFVDLCQRIIDWKAKGYFDPAAPAEFPASQNKIGLTGDVVMVSCGLWVSGEIEEMTGAQIEWGSFPYPIDPDFEDGTTGASVSSTCNCINVNCENPDLAWEYMYYMATGEVNKAITDADVYLVDDRTQEPLPRFAEAQDILAGITENINYAGHLHDNADIKTSINDVVIQLYSGAYATGEEAAAAFDALVQ
ncbi:MAG: extracellular solute-binding protein [Oscillospiraceae bacterium]|nr:extracellular solute-binding protein [Oscillospiraceae bacterium]